MHRFDFSVPTPPHRPTTIAARHRIAVIASVVLHLAAVGALWSAQGRRAPEWRLAGRSGSVTLEASIARPTPPPRTADERLSPIAVRIEPQRVRIDRKTFVPTPTDEPVEAAPIAVRPSSESSRPLRPTSAEPSPRVAARPAPPLRQVAAAAPPVVAVPPSIARAAGHDETLPTAVENPPPQYPPQAVALRQQGTTWLRIVVDEQGRVVEVGVTASSGYAVLDACAAQAARRWRFTPGRRDGAAAPFTLHLPMQFTLD